MAWNNRPSGWTALHRSAGLRYDEHRSVADVEFVNYVTWCYRCEGESDCEDGIIWTPKRWSN